MFPQSVAASVTQMAAATQQFPEYLLNSESWAWGAYVGVRYALIGTYHELRELAATIHSLRQAAGRPATLAQRTLALHHAALRDFQVLLLGIDDGLYRQTPAVGEWPIYTILTHVHYVERYFFATILNALNNPQPQRSKFSEVGALLGEPTLLDDKLPLAEQWADYERLHNRVLSELASLSDSQLAIEAPMWERVPIAVRFRLHRFDAHLREHTNQLEKSLRWLDRVPNESKLLLRQLYAAWAEVEGALLGAADLAEAECAAVASVIQSRTADLLATIERMGVLAAAIQSGDQAQVEKMIAAEPRLSATRAENDLSQIMTAMYSSQPALALILAAAKGDLDIFESAATGNLAEVKLNVQYDPDSLNSVAKDGFSALQLACYFGHEEIVRCLLDAGADLHAVAQNAMRIQPLHAAVSNGNHAIIRLLLERGADVNARQQDDFTPLMAARQNNDQTLIALLKQFGAEEG